MIFFETRNKPSRQITDITFLVFKTFSRSVEVHGWGFGIGIWALRHHFRGQLWKSLSWGSRYFESVVKLNCLCFSHWKMKELSEMKWTSVPGTVSDRREVQGLGMNRKQWVKEGLCEGLGPSSELLRSYSRAEARRLCDCICVLVSKSSNNHYLTGTKNSPKGLMSFHP